MSDSPYTKMSREEIADSEVGNTAISRPMSFGMVAAFIVTIVGVPLVQHAIEIRAGFMNGGSWVWPKAYEICEFPKYAWRELVDPANGSLMNRLKEANGSLMRSFQSYEDALESDSFIALMTLPHTQAFTAEFLGLGNEQVALGRNGWLFYHPDVTYLTGPGFLDPSFQRSRARSGSSARAVQPDPIKAIVRFRDQLQSRGIHLVVMPIPVKPMIEPEFLSQADARSRIPLQNPSYSSFLDSLNRAGIDYLDVSQALARRKRLMGPQFLRTDTHWTPEAMEAAVALLADKIRGIDTAQGGPLIELRQSAQVVEGIGDIAAMLKLPVNSHLYSKETIVIRPVIQANGDPWSPDQRADILVLGDSFFNIFSLEEMGWGVSAGFVEQLSFSLQRPLDAILRNDAGALATREVLSQELARGRDRLDGKRLVVWEFAMRELASGDWDFVPLKIPERAPKSFLALESGERDRVHATVKSLGPIPGQERRPIRTFSPRSISLR